MHDDEAVFVAMKDTLGFKGINCTEPTHRLVCTTKGVERAIQTLKSEMRTIRADLNYQPPTNLTGEFLSAVARALNWTPNSRTGQTTARYQLISDKSLCLKRFRFGQGGVCECRGADSSDERVKRRI